MRICLLMACLLPVPLLAGEIIAKAPDSVDADTRYLFYLHGQIVEDVGLRPTHPRWGLYDYPLILEALAQDGITVISERRPQGTNHNEYATKIKKQVQRLLKAGANSAHITVMGFSAGGMITTRVSDKSAGLNINFIIMASCSGWLDNSPELTLHGTVLSVYEKSDGPQSCTDLAARKPGPESFDEVMIDTGKEHGAFYLPRDTWLAPVLEWVRSR